MSRRTGPGFPDNGWVESINGRKKQGDEVQASIGGIRFAAYYWRAIIGRPHRCVVWFPTREINRNGNYRRKFKSVSTWKVS